MTTVIDVSLSTVWRSIDVAGPAIWTDGEVVRLNVISEQGHIVASVPLTRDEAVQVSRAIRGNIAEHNREVARQ